MSKKSILIIIVVFLSIFFTTVCFGEGSKVEVRAPYFKVESGDNKILTLDMLKEKVIVIFYEQKDVIKKNQKLKDELNKLYSNQSDTEKELIVRLPIIDCSSVFRPFVKMWKTKLKENSEKEGITIYGDWDGKMSFDYKMKTNESNFLVIDKKGIIRYFTSGKIEDEEIVQIKDLLKRLRDEG